MGCSHYLTDRVNPLHRPINLLFYHPAPTRAFTMTLRNQFIAFTLSLLLCGHAYSNSSLKRGGSAYKAGKFDAAFSAFIDAARAGDPVAQFLVASMYQEGRGTLRSTELAARWYALAAEQGDADARFALAEIHLANKPTPTTAKKALAALQQAAKANHAEAMNRLAALLMEGQHNTQDHEAAQRWLHKAAKLGNLNASYNLAGIYASGVGVERSSANALRWYKSAAIGGHPGAQAQLGSAYAEGTLGEANLPLAYAWLNLAAQADVKVASENLAILKPKLSAEQVQFGAQELDRLRARITQQPTNTHEP